MPKSDEQIAMEYEVLWESGEMKRNYNPRLLAALAAARAQQHAECVRLLREEAFGNCGLAEWDCDTMADFLEEHKP